MKWLELANHLNLEIEAVEVRWGFTFIEYLDYGYELVSW